MVSRDSSLNVILDLDGQVLVVDPEGGHWVRFSGKRWMRYCATKE